MFSNEFAEAKAVVFWDVDDYKIPDGLDAGEVSKNIKAAALADNVFVSAGIKLKRVSEGSKGKDSSRDLAIHSRMWLWTIDNVDESSTIMVISDNLFDGTVEKFKEMNHNVVWRSLSAEGKPIAHTRGGRRSSERDDHVCSGCVNPTFLVDPFVKSL
ncbi:PREDICTED: uncharacterized protein LOC104707643 [Camelina sativa]|uniref:Uncharacterized protein LOC104707643 n=1 Tax=Camelina sativa TaxID=90675 RepID=A0ABM1QD31_CAMSA|nr:PREDICTED: uncharacterized protein LOC104707643 [Camelina sativa]